MSKDAKIKPGESATAIVRKGKGRQSRAGRAREAADEETSSVEEETRKSGLPRPDETTRYFRRGGITVYDLGTRRVGTEGEVYEEVVFPPFVSGSPFGQRLGLLTSYTTPLLAGEYDKMKSCLKLPQAAHGLYVDFAFNKFDTSIHFPQEGEEYLEIVGEKETRPYIRDYPVKWMEVVQPPEPELVHESNWKGAKLKFSKKDKWHLTVDSLFHYNPFTTFPTERFKITETANPAEVEAADPVELDFSKPTPTRIYLTPRTFWLGTAPGGGVDTHYTMTRFLPVVPDFEFWTPAPRVTRIAFDLFQFHQMQAWATEELWSMLIPYYYSKGHPVTEIMPHSWWVGADSALDHARYLDWPGISATFQGVIVAVIVRGGKTYHVWRIDPTGSMADRWGEVRIHHPLYVPGVGIP